MKRQTSAALFGLLLAANAPAAVDLGQVEVPTIGHGFFSSLPGVPRTVVDFLIDQDQASGGGAVLTSFSANFDINNQFVLTISAPPGQKFLIQPPAGKSVRFGGGMDWQGLFPDGPSYFGTLAVSFSGLEGAAPDFSASRTVLSELHGFVGFNEIQSTLFSNTLAFASITLTATVPSTNVGSGTMTYTPTSDAAFTIRYTTTQTTDPGSFVSLIPEPSATSLLLPGAFLTLVLARNRRPLKPSALAS